MEFLISLEAFPLHPFNYLYILYVGHRRHVINCCWHYYRRHNIFNAPPLTQLLHGYNNTSDFSDHFSIIVLFDQQEPECVNYPTHLPNIRHRYHHNLTTIIIIYTTTSMTYKHYPILYTEEHSFVPCSV